MISELHRRSDDYGVYRGRAERTISPRGGQARIRRPQYGTGAVRRADDGVHPLQRRLASTTLKRALETGLRECAGMSLEAVAR